MKDIDDTLLALHAARNDLSEAFHIMAGLELVASNEDIVMLLASALGSKDSEVRSGAALGYRLLFSRRKHDVTLALPLLIKAAADSAPWVVFHAAKALGRIRERDPSCGLHMEEIVCLFVASLESEDSQVRAAAADEFRSVYSHRELIIPPLVARLDDPVLEVRFAAARTLCDFGAKAHEALPKFLEWIDNEIPEEAFVASIAVIQMDDA